MFMPFVRLITIYVLVAVAVLGVFNRDKVAQLLGYGGNPAATQQAELPPIPTAPSAETAAETAAETPTAPVVAKAVVPPVETAAPVAPATGETAEATPAAPAQAAAEPAPDVDSRINAARRAFWDGDVDQAERLYAALAGQFPDRADIAGELGNIYYTAGRYPEAAQYYYVVAQHLLADGNKAQAQAMIAVLVSIAPDMAKDLETAASKQTN